MVAFILVGLLCVAGLAFAAAVITHQPWRRIMFFLIVFAMVVAVGLLLL